MPLTSTSASGSAAKHTPVYSLRSFSSTGNVTHAIVSNFLSCKFITTNAKTIPPSKPINDFSMPSSI